MYFKDFPKFLYDFNYGDGKTKTTIVTDITRNIRVRKEILNNVTIYDEYDIVDGETPEIIAEKFYGTPQYHWIVMLANEKFDWLTDFPLTETQLVKHIASSYNPTLYSDDWFWDTHEDGRRYIHIKITGGSADPFQVQYLTAPVTITLYDATKQFQKVINFPTDEIGLDEGTQYFYFPYVEPWDITQFGTGDSSNGVGNIRIYVDTEGRENNPVMYVNPEGFITNPETPYYEVGDTDKSFPIYPTPLSGAEIHRIENDLKRRIKLISPDLVEVVLRNYEELLR